ncbi:MAG: hypothetical protein IJG25_03540 [Thermoguttaceae bacterium]|nr:hypothetical protein [Thermoguttaceae bacterium]
MTMKLKLKKTTDAVAVKVDISEWTDDVEAFVKALTMREKMVFTDCLSKYIDKDTPETDRAEAILSGCVMVLVDKEGLPLFTLEDIPQLMECSFIPVNRIIQTVTDQNEGISFVKN